MVKKIEKRDLNIIEKIEWFGYKWYYLLIGCDRYNEMKEIEEKNG